MGEITANMKPQTFFITATDTDAGKSYISALMLQGLKQGGKVAVGVKPIAAGANIHAENGDALLLQQYSGIALPYALINPICYQAPVAPHLAAINEQHLIDEVLLDQSLLQWQQLKADVVLVEGAGGWLLPLNDKRYLADWVAQHQLPVILVVGMKLGCLNHAMLSVREIERSGCKLIGWVANCVDPDMALLAENIADLKTRISAPCLAVVPHNPEQRLRDELSLKLAQALV